MRLSSRSKIIERLMNSKTYRNAYVLEHIKNGVAFQMRTLREERNWTQGKLGEMVNKPRNVISRLEDPNYGKFTLATLLEIASGLDVGLMVKFVPFSRLVREYDDVSPKTLSAKSVTEKAEMQALAEWAAEEDIALETISSKSRVAILSEQWDFLCNPLTFCANQTFCAKPPQPQEEKPLN